MPPSTLIGIDASGFGAGPWITAPVAALWSTKASPSPPAAVGPIWNLKCACSEVVAVSVSGARTGVGYVELTGYVSQ